MSPDSARFTLRAIVARHFSETDARRTALETRLRMIPSRDDRRALALISEEALRLGDLAGRPSEALCREIRTLREDIARDLRETRMEAVR